MRRKPPPLPVHGPGSYTGIRVRVPRARPRDPSTTGDLRHQSVAAVDSLHWVSPRRSVQEAHEAHHAMAGRCIMGKFPSHKGSPTTGPVTVEFHRWPALCFLVGLTRAERGGRSPSWRPVPRRDATGPVVSSSAQREQCHVDVTRTPPRRVETVV